MSKSENAKHKVLQNLKLVSQVEKRELQQTHTKDRETNTTATTINTDTNKRQVGKRATGLARTSFRKVDNGIGRL